MAVLERQVDRRALQALVPLNGLSRPHFDELVGKSEVRELAAGRYLFREGERDGKTYFLIAGDIALMQGRQVKETLRAGSEAARHPIAHQQPRQLAAKAPGRATVLAVDSGLLDVMLAWDQSNNYQVTEIQSEDDEDWMTRMLQSELFQRLPATNIQQVLMRMQEHPVAAGAVVVSQDEEGDYYYMIKQGRAKVVRRPGPQDEPVEVASLRDGDSFGEEALLSGTRRNADVVMLTDGVLMRLSKADFDALLREPLIQQLGFDDASKLAAQGAAWLDVRLPGEYDNAHLPRSLNIPLATLRERIGELRHGQAYIVCCDTGTRSGGAAFLLSQRGFETYVLAGGLNAVARDAFERAPEAAPATADRPTETVPVGEPLPAGQAAALARVRSRAAAILTETRRRGRELRKRLTAMEDAIAEREARARALDEALQEKERELRALHRSFERSEAMGEELETLRADVAKLRAQTTRQQRDLEQAHHAGAEREQELTLLREQLAELEQAQATLAAEREAARGEAAALRTRTDELEEARRELAEARERAAQAEALQGQIEGLQAELTALEQRLTASEAAAASARAALEERMRGERAETEALHQRIANEAELAAASAARLQQLEEELACTRGQAESLQRERDEAVQQAARLEAQADDAASERAAELASLQQRLQESEAAATGLRQALETARDESTQHRAELEQLRQAEARLEEELAARRGAEQERDAAREELGARVAELEAALEAERRRIQAAREEERGALHAQLAAQVEEAEGRLREAEEQLRTLARQRDEERHGHEEQCARLRTEIEELQAQKEALVAEAEARTAELAGERHTAQEAGQRLESLQDQHEALRRELEQARLRVEELEHQGRQVQALEGARTALEEQLAQARAEHERALEEAGAEHGARAEELLAEHARSTEEHARAAEDWSRVRAALQEQLEGEREARAGAEAAHTRLQEDRAALEARLEGEIDRAGALAHQLHGAREELAAALDARARLEAEAGERSARIEELETALAAREASIEDATDTLRRERGALREDLAREQEALRDAEQRLRTVEDELAQARGALESLQFAGAGAEAARAEVEGIRALADQELRAAAEEMTRLRAELAQAQQQLREQAGGGAQPGAVAPGGSAADGLAPDSDVLPPLGIYATAPAQPFTPAAPEQAGLVAARRRRYAAIAGAVLVLAAGGAWWLASTAAQPVDGADGGGIAFHPPAAEADVRDLGGLLADRAPALPIAAPGARGGDPRNAVAEGEHAVDGVPMR